MTHAQPDALAAALAAYEAAVRINGTYGDFVQEVYADELIDAQQAHIVALATAQTQAAKYVRSAWDFLRAMTDEAASENIHSLRREATEDVELALRVLGVDVYAATAQADGSEGDAE